MNNYNKLCFMLASSVSNATCRIEKNPKSKMPCYWVNSSSILHTFRTVWSDSRHVLSQTHGSHCPVSQWWASLWWWLPGVSRQHSWKELLLARMRQEGSMLVTKILACVLLRLSSHQASTAKPLCTPETWYSSCCFPDSILRNPRAAAQEGIYLFFGWCP